MTDETIATSPFEHLSLEALIEIDKAAGAILDGSGFGEIAVLFEFGDIKKVLQTVSKKVTVPRRVA